jgi:signal transduction histidine kinase
LSSDMRILVGKYARGMEDVAFIGYELGRRDDPYSVETEEAVFPRAVPAPAHDAHGAFLRKPPGMPWIEAPLKRDSEIYGKVSVDNLGHPDPSRFKLEAEMHAQKTAATSESLSAIHNLVVQVALALQHLRVRDSMAELLAQYVHYSASLFGLITSHASVLNNSSSTQSKTCQDAYADIISISAHIGTYSRTVLNFCDLLRQFKPAEQLCGQRIDLTTISNEVIATCSFRAREFNCSVQTEPQTDFWAKVDPIAIRQMLFILVTNAIQSIGYQKLRTRPGIVQIKFCRGNPGQVIISVADNGPGVPEDLLDILFEPRVRGAAYEGLGLGLYLVRWLSRMHQGGVELKRNSENSGAEFEILVQEFPISL